MTTVADNPELDLFEVLTELERLAIVERDWPTQKLCKAVFILSRRVITLKTENEELRNELDIVQSQVEAIMLGTI